MEADAQAIAGASRGSYLGQLLLIFGAVTCASTAAEAGEKFFSSPTRVVSMNVCTDQLAMLLAGPGQLVSVSHIASDPGSSAMAEEAERYPVNHGLAEEIFLLKPDLVLAGTYTTRVTTEMLGRLGIRVETFAPESSLDDVRANVRRMGTVLGREEQAETLLENFDEGLRSLSSKERSDVLVATYSSNSYTTGAGSLTAAVIEAAGLRNLGSELGIYGAGRLALEELVMARPDVLTSDTPIYGAPALAQENFRHPAFRALQETAALASVPSAYWICGGPSNLIAATMLRDAAKAAPRE